MEFEFSGADIKSAKLIEPQRWYVFEIKDLEKALNQAKDANNYKFTLVGVNGDAEGVPITVSFSTKSEYSRGQLAKFYGHVTGEHIGEQGGKVDFNVLIGKQVGGYVITDTFNDQERNKITKYLSASEVPGA